MFWVIFDNPGFKQEHFSSKMFKLQSENSDQPKDRNLYSMVVILFVLFCSIFVVVVVVCQSRGYELRLFLFSSLTM